MEVRFLADSMLGKLAKWLRVMGYDAYYESFDGAHRIYHLVQDGRLLLSRNRPITEQYPDSLLIRSDQVKEQLQEIRDAGYIKADRSKWFMRCLICNIQINEVTREDARENIPEYIFYQNKTAIRFCPSCGRYFWPGSHRNRMIRQLEEWGFKYS
ncbi:MAG: hypothetical protein JRC68_08980 [Deltaproteobacteria bacterium]|nr:hypothetical protein [Deltaproteobacteria bacterium]